MEWDGPLIRISGANIVVASTSNHTINGGWSAGGTARLPTNGGKTKPRFFYSHGLDDSSVTGLNVKNTPIQAFSVQSTNLALNCISVDNSDGHANSGHSTDAFDAVPTIPMTP